MIYTGQPDDGYDFEHEEAGAPEQETNETESDVLETKRLLRTSGEFFIEFFHGEDMEFGVPPIHKDVWKLFTNTALARILLAIPRDHAKTTLSKLGVIWYWLFTNHRFCIYLSNTIGRAKDACRDIMNFLRRDNFVSLYGNVRIIKESETENIWIFELKLGNGRVKQCILRAASANQSMRGINVDNQRPDIAVVDDVEDEENTSSEILQKKLDRWMFGTFLKALAKRRKIIWLGNMLAKTSLLARLAKNPKWNPVVFGSIVRNNITGQLEPLWPDRWSFEELVEDFEEYRDLGLVELWMCEMMNMPGHGENGFRSDQFFYQPIPNPEDCVAAWLVLDPAFGEDAENDDSSITVHVLPKEGVPMVVNEVTGKMKEEEIFTIMHDLAQYWNAWVWGIEAVAAQKVMITLFKVYATTKGVVHMIEFIPLLAGKGDPKLSRIKAFMGLMDAKEYAVFEGAVNITTQALQFVFTKKKQRDDLLDSCAYGPQMLDQYMDLLIAQFTTHGIRTETPVRSGRRVACV